MLARFAWSGFCGISVSFRADDKGLAAIKWALWLEQQRALYGLVFLRCQKNAGDIVFGGGVAAWPFRSTHGNKHGYSGYY